MNTITDRTVTTSFTVNEDLLERVRELAGRRGTSVTKLIVDALQAELISDEVAGGEHSNGRPATGSWSMPIIVEKQWTILDAPLPMWERKSRIAEVRRMFGAVRTVLPSRVELIGLPVECLAPAQAAFDAQLARSLAERERRISELYERENSDGNT